MDILEKAALGISGMTLDELADMNSDDQDLSSRIRSAETPADGLEIIKEYQKQSKSKLEIFDVFLNCWLDCSDKTEDEVKKEAEQCEVMYRVNGQMKSWKDS